MQQICKVDNMMEDMFLIHCNKCYKNHEPDEPNIRFHLTRCHHIVCGKCLNSTTATNSESKKKCPVCERPFQGVSITHKIPPTVANYFEDPSKFLQLYKKVTKFQSEQHDSLMKHIYELERIIPEDERILNGYMKLEIQLTEEVEKEKQRIAELTNYVEFYERPDITMYLCRYKESDNNTSDSDETVNMYNLKRPRTPSLSATDTDVDESICAVSQKVEQDILTPRKGHVVLDDDFFL